MIINYDLSISEELTKISKKIPIVLYGAEEKGREIYHYLSNAGFANIFICDGNPRKWGKLFNKQKKINSLVWLFDYVQKNDVFICACVEQPEDVYMTILEMAKTKTSVVRCVSYWGMMRAIYINKEFLFADNTHIIESFEYENQLEILEMYKQYVGLYSSLFNIEDDCIWLILPGKTGSSSILEAINKTEKKCIQIHSLELPQIETLPPILEKTWSEFVRKRITRPIKIICAVREPLSRDFSAFFQPCTHNVDRLRIAGFTEPNLQLTYNWYMDAILRGNKYIREYLGKCIFPNWVEEFDWLDDQLKDKLGIDVFEHEFDKEKGYEIIIKDNIELFLYKSEKINSILDEMGRFIGIENFSLCDENVSRKKKYGMAYDLFRDKVVLSVDYVNHYYANNAKMNHFYSDEEKNMFLSKWKANI